MAMLAADCPPRVLDLGPHGRLLPIREARRATALLSSHPGYSEEGVSRSLSLHHAGIHPINSIKLLSDIAF